MTPVLMEFLTSDGAPLGFARVEVRLTRSDFDKQESGIIMPRLINVVTGLDGKVLVPLMPCSTRYHVTVYDTVSDAALHYQFYVPTINKDEVSFLRLQDLIADDVVISPVAYDEATLLTMLTAKATTLTAKDKAVTAKDEAVDAQSMVSEIAHQVAADKATVASLVQQIPMPIGNTVVGRGTWAHGIYFPGNFVGWGTSLWFLIGESAYESSLPPNQDMAHWFEFAPIPGAAGPQGHDGIQGAQGPKGDAGLPGPMGPAGPKGDPGAPGATGAQGLQGAQGIKGDAGATGPAGPQGLKGDTGLTGPQGIAGTKGNAGATGATGAVGPAGPQGQQGIQGPQGPKGDAGSAGASIIGRGGWATGVYSPGNYVSFGSSLFFLIGNADYNSLASPNLDLSHWFELVAIPGPAGPQGLKGGTGAAGAQGIQGVAGTDGKTVRYGATVPAAGLGNDGDFYVNTSTNYLYGPKVGGTWPAGISLVGPAGATGAQGAQGIQGIQGAKGDTGATGPQGASDTSNVSVTAVSNTLTFDYSQGQHQYATFPDTATKTIAVTNWPATGKTGTLLLELTNAGKAPSITWPAAVKFVLSNGALSSAFASTGLTLQAAGIDFVLLWTRDAGATIYAKVMR